MSGLLVKRFELALEKFHSAYSDPYADAEDRGDARRALNDARQALLNALKQVDEAYAEGRKDEREAQLTADPGPCEHRWDLVHSGATYHDLKCSKCGEVKRETWD